MEIDVPTEYPAGVGYRPCTPCAVQSSAVSETAVWGLGTSLGEWPHPNPPARQSPLHANPQTPTPTPGLEKEGALGGVGPVEIDSGAFETGPTPPNPEP